MERDVRPQSNSSARPHSGWHEIFTDDGSPRPIFRKVLRDLSELPPTEQMPAAPLVVGAYVFVLVVFFVYMLSVAKRVGAVQREVQSLEAELKDRKKA